ncbi:hypothetical protein BJ878DRAFT_497128 [Calycina marina]|uniref:Uncharacterized protein n=1 Tax=Calycina marina TaxID=1763456 RepID=A0A9P7Z7S2_9HELO|nr:hypothetical protein BJ878DRAFT_497128 [Calycina marina]
MTVVKNLDQFLARAQYDPSLSSKLLQEWEASLVEQLDIQSLKCGKLLHFNHSSLLADTCICRVCYLVW